MTIRVWRIVKSRHADEAFSGRGTRRNGGRWTSPGRPVAYCTSSTPLAMLELLVHLHGEDLTKRYTLFHAEFEEALVTTVDASSLPRGWRGTPPPGELQRIGDEWLQTARSPVLRVPSAVVPTEWNYLLNPLPPDFAKIQLGTRQLIRFDRRLK